MTHTKGPWLIGKRNENDNTVTVGEHPSHSAIAYVAPRPHYANNQEANARLIAAAPGLLKVVELLVNDTADLDIVIGMGREAIRIAKEKR